MDRPSEHPDPAMAGNYELVNAELARVTAERKRLQKLVSAVESRRRARRDHALRIATVAFCHEPAAIERIATALLRKYRTCIDASITDCTEEIEQRFIDTPVDTLALWLDWEGDVARGELVEAKRLVEEMRLLSWVDAQNSTQGVAPPPQFVWEKRCSLSIENSTDKDRRASADRPLNSAAAKKWLQRFRRRWGLVLGRQPAKDLLPLDTMRCKANAWDPQKTPPFHFLAPILGPPGGPRFGSIYRILLFRGFQKMDPFLIPCFHKKAMASWQWFHFLVGQVPPLRKVLVLNLDETSIRFWYQPRLGLRGRGRDKPRGAGPARQASRAQLRKALTHVAIICDDVALQPYLPQVLLVNERTATVRSLKSWKPIPGCKAEVWRGKSAWINDSVFGDIVTHLGAVLKTHALGRQAILLMDAHTCHFSEMAMAAAYAQDIWPCIIPASMTSLLQPLDTHVFARFKLFLRTRMHQLMLTGKNKDLETEEILDALMHAMKGVLQRHEWAPSFAMNGYGPVFKIRQRLLDVLEWSEQPLVSTALPCYDQFQSCFPRGRHIPFMAMLAGVLPQSERPPKRPRTSGLPASSNDDEPQPWTHRLRPRRLGRAMTGKAKAKVAAAKSDAAEPKAATIVRVGAMSSSSGHVLLSLKPFPPGNRRSRSALLESPHGE